MLFVVVVGMAVHLASGGTRAGNKHSKDYDKGDKRYDMGWSKGESEDIFDFGLFSTTDDDLDRHGHKNKNEKNGKYDRPDRGKGWDNKPGPDDDNDNEEDLSFLSTLVDENEDWFFSSTIDLTEYQENEDVAFLSTVNENQEGIDSLNDNNTNATSVIRTTQTITTPTELYTTADETEFGTTEPSFDSKIADLIISTNEAVFSCDRFDGASINDCPRDRCKKIELDDGTKCVHKYNGKHDKTKSAENKQSKGFMSDTNGRQVTSQIVTNSFSVLQFDLSFSTTDCWFHRGFIGFCSHLPDSIGSILLQGEKT